MANIFRRDFSGGWYPSADAVNAPPNILLRADNVILDDEGVISSRYGSASINPSTYSALLSVGAGSNDVHSLYSAVIGGIKHRFVGVGNNVVIHAPTSMWELGGNADSPLVFAGSGDIAMSDGYGQVFIARSTTKKKRAGGNSNVVATNWGMAAPSLAPLAVAQNPVFKLFATCDQTESPGFTANEGTITVTYPTGSDDTANGAVEVTPAASGRGTITKTFLSDQDFLNIYGQGDDRDIFDILAWVAEPDKAKRVSIMIGLGTGADPFQDDYYLFDFVIDSSSGLPSNVNLQDPTVINDAIDDTQADPPQNPDPAPFAPDDGPVNGGPAEPPVEVGPFFKTSNVRTARRDQAYNPGWTHYSCLRGQFKRVGTTAGRNWQTVRAIKVVYTTTAGATGVIRYDTIKMIGGALQGSLTGQFKFRWRGVKDYSTFAELTPVSPASAEVEFVGQRAQVTIPLAQIQALDSQADAVWTYFYGGILDKWYRCAKAKIGGTSSSFRIDEFARTPDGSVNATDRTRYTCFGFGIPAGTSGQTADLIIDLTSNEIEAMILNESFDDREVVPPDDIIGIVAEYYQRAFVITQTSGADGFCYISERRRPGLFKANNAFRIGSGSEALYWIKKTTGGLFIGTARDIYALEGDAAELQDGTLDIKLTALNIGSPPVDACVAQEGNSLIYRAADGMRTFDGVSSQPVPRNAVELLHRGQTRHGVSPLNLATGRFRAALSKGVLTMLAPEGSETTSTNTMYRADFNRGVWYRATYPSMGYAVLCREPDGTVIAGATTGVLVTLDTGSTDVGISGGIPVSTARPVPVVWTKVDDDGHPLSKKDLFDLSLEMDTGNAAAAIDIHLDNSGSAATNGSTTATCNGHAFYKRALSNVASCREIQVRITQSAALPTFKLYSLNIAYRPRPQQRMYVDTGYVKVDHQDVTWQRQARILVNTPSDLTVTPYFDDVAGTAVTLAATANVTKIYEIPMGREQKGGQPRLTIATTNSAGTTEPLGFELYWAEFIYVPSGNETAKKRLRVYGEQM